MPPPTRLPDSPTSQSPGFCSQMKCFAPEIQSVHLCTATGSNFSNTALMMTCLKMNMGGKAESQSVSELSFLFCHPKMTMSSHNTHEMALSHMLCTVCSVFSRMTGL